MQSLTKENFWDVLHARFPDAVDEFYKWIDEYKARNNWEGLIKPYPIKREPIEDGKVEISFSTKSMKFHDLPYAMQYGIWAEYSATVWKAGAWEYERLIEWIEVSIAYSQKLINRSKSKVA
jgi:hypothetical protein